MSVYIQLRRQHRLK